MIIDKLLEHKVKAYAFVGPSGTGKSYRAQMVAGEKNIEYIIDDGLLIKGNEVVAGISAKKAPTKIETVKNALFQEPSKKEEMLKAIKKEKPNSILILGTSDGMVEKIANNLNIGPIIETVYIQDVATEEEMETARRTRVTQGKHVIPVPTFAIKKDFSGFILDPLQIFKSKGKGKEPYMDEKSIIRPTFSYLGNFTISDLVFRQIIDYLADKSKSVHKLNRVIIKKHDGATDGIYIYIEITIKYGFNAIEEMKKFKSKIKKEIENLTAMNVLDMDIIVKGVYYEEKNN